MRLKEVLKEALGEPGPWRGPSALSCSARPAVVPPLCPEEGQSAAEPSSLSYCDGEHSIPRELGAERMSPGIRTHVLSQFPTAGPWEILRGLGALGFASSGSSPKKVPAGSKMLPTPGLQGGATAH